MFNLKAQELKKVCHLTTVHKRYDTRIFVKECKSLARNGFKVNLIVADGNGSEIQSEVQIHDIGLPKSRIRRVLFSGRKMYRKAIEVDAEIYHFHDPELVFVAKKLVAKGKKVIYDVHEDVPRQILTKTYIPKVFLKNFSSLIEYFEDSASKRFHYVITATNHIKNRFLKINPNVKTVHNYPFLTEFEDIETLWSTKKDTVCYIGSITEVRGIYENVEAIGVCKQKLTIAGVFQPESYLEKCKTSAGWKYVDFVGFVDRKKMSKILSKSKAGLVTLHPTINYIDALPVKMFEYMAAGIPVIASNFELWKSIVNEANCGICVDPLNIMEIADAISYLIENNEVAKQMGLNGRKAVLEKYNWESEEQVLINTYLTL